MRLGALVHMYPPMHNAGAEHMLHGMLTEMVRRGVPCSVAISPYSGDDYEIDGVRVGGLKVIDDCTVLLTHLDRTPDAEAFATARGVPVAHIMHNHLRPGMAEVCDLAVYNTEWIATTYPTRGCPRSIVVHPPIWQDRYRVKTGACVTLVNLSRAKGGPLFYELARAMPSVRFLGVRGAYGEQVPAPALPNVTIMEQQADIRTAYRKTRIVLMPSAYESYGRVGVEAAVSGIPCIANGTPGLREALGAAGVFPASLDVQSWKSALEDVLTSWGSYSAAASEHASHLDPAYDVARLIGALESMPKRQAVGVCDLAERTVKEKNMYISRNRVVRGGFLIAFKGEVMTEAEAKKRGLPVEDGTVAKIKKADKAIEAERAEAKEAVIATAVPGGKRPGRKSSK